MHTKLTIVASLMSLLIFTGCQNSNGLADGSIDSAGIDGPRGCQKYATWPGRVLGSGFNTFGNEYSFAASVIEGPFPQMSLLALDYHTNPNETYPKTTTFDLSSKANSCDGCVLIAICESEDLCEGKYFAQAGTLTIDKASSDPAFGQMQANATQLKLVEWQFPSEDSEIDRAIPGGGCIEIGNVTWNASWDNRTDAGVTDASAIDLPAMIDASVPVDATVKD